MNDTEERPQESKLRQRVTEAHLAVSRATQMAKAFESYLTGKTK